jgi:hypothetical protein
MDWAAGLKIKFIFLKLSCVIATCLVAVPILCLFPPTPPLIPLHYLDKFHMQRNADVKDIGAKHQKK